MLDLKLLERQLDETLSKETTETLSSWLVERRLRNCISAILGEGEYDNILINKIEIAQSKEHNVISSGLNFIQDYVCSDSDYLLAA